MTVHDELDISVPKTADGIRKLFKMKYLMEHAYELKVPLKAEIEIGDNWADVSLLDFDKLHMSRDEHERLKPYFKEKLSHNYSYVNMKQELFLRHLSNASVVKQIEKLTAVCEDIDDARDAYKKAHK